jgi:hypothetical protein
MPQNNAVAIKNLKLDLTNYRTVPQQNEASALEAMILISSDRFWALMESLLETGYLPTENVIVLNVGQDMIVKEGNRRVAALKFILGHIACGIQIPSAIQKMISGLTPQWKVENSQVPCAIYASQDSVLVDKIVTLAHGKGEKAGRDQWAVVARARHNRDANGASEPALDLLEKYLKVGRNVTFQQADRWAGDFPLSILDEAMQKLAVRIGTISPQDFARQYPSIQHRTAVDDVINDIGLGLIQFKHIRSKSIDFAAKYQISLTPTIPVATIGSGNSVGTSVSAGMNAGVSAGVSNVTTPGSTGTTPVASTAPSISKSTALAITDPRGVIRALKKLKVVGNNRSKVVTLQKEAVKLDLGDHPIAFCFLLRSMFEISAKVYCDEQSPVISTIKPNGKEKTLAEILSAVTTHLTGNGADKVLVKILHGAQTELTKPDGILSVTSMNQLVHNQRFSVTAGDISSVFGNIFSLLEAMNK